MKPSFINLESCEFSLVLEKNNQEEGRFESIKSILPHPLLKPNMASIEFAFNSISLEVLGSHLHVDTIRDEPRMWFVSSQAANTLQEHIYKGK